MEHDDFIKKRYIELANKAYKNNVYTYTNFLNNSELTLFHQTIKDIPFVSYTSFGGNDLCERQVLCFGNEKEMGYKPSFPITMILIAPIIDKFSDQFTHRDFLGAMINLGIERNTLGDIFVKNNKGYVYCLDKIADYIIENLQKVKHTHVKCIIVDNCQTEFTPTFEELRITVASERIDAIIAALIKLSRSKTIELFRSKKVFINSRLVEHNDYKLCENDIISLRGYGKFIYIGIIQSTKKGKVVLGIKKLI